MKTANFDPTQMVNSFIEKQKEAQTQIQNFAKDFVSALPQQMSTFAQEQQEISQNFGKKYIELFQSEPTNVEKIIKTTNDLAYAQFTSCMKLLNESADLMFSAKSVKSK